MVDDDLGRHGRIWPEANSETTDFELSADLLTGQWSNPLRVVAFNVAEGWSRDTSADVAQELRRPSDEQFREIPLGLKDSIDRYEHLCVPKTLSELMTWWNRLSWRNDRVALFRSGHPGLAIQVEVAAGSRERGASASVDCLAAQAAWSRPAHEP
jgi:hypothetical protein